MQTPQAVVHVTGPLSEHLDSLEFATLSGYRRRGGYEAARAVIGKRGAQAVVDELRASGLCGRSDGVPVATAWSGLAGTSRVSGPRYLVCNAERSEPGAFKDRVLLERAPHRLLEGMLIAAYAIGAEVSFLRVRGDLELAAERLARAIAEAEAAGALGERCLGGEFRHRIILVRGAGAAICGEPTALLASLEGRRGLPHPAGRSRDLFAQPVVVHEVETLCQVPLILANGASWFRGGGSGEHPGTTLFEVCGHVARPGLYELSRATPLDEIVFEHAGGVPGERKLKGVLPAGLSSPALPVGQLDVSLPEASLRTRGGGNGDAATIVMDDSTCMVRTACSITQYYRRESCGQCTQCRQGSRWLDRVVNRIERGAATRLDLDLLADLCRIQSNDATCAIPDRAAAVVRSLLWHFRADFDAHLRSQGCPFDGSFELP